MERGAGQRLAQLRGTPGVVDMAMGQQDALDVQAEFGDGAEDVRDVAAGVDHEGGLGLVVPDQGAILLQRGDWDDGRLQFGHRCRLSMSVRTALRRRRVLRIFHVW